MISKALDSYGLASRAVFRQAGLDFERLSQPHARYSYTSIQRLWSAAVEATADACFGLRVASFWHPTTFHALGYSWLASNNLAEGFDRVVRYSSVLNTAAKGMLQINKSPETYCFAIAKGGVFPPPQPAAMDAGMATILIMCRAAYGDSFRPQRVTMRHASPGCTEQFAELFKAPVEFSQERYAMYIDPNVANEPLSTANPELVRVNDRVVTDYLAKLNRSDIVMRVHSKLIERMPSGQIDEANIAATINLSQRTLQRKLKTQGVSFSVVLDTARRDLGLQYVRSSQYSLNEIAYLLGFAEPGNFSRAFRRWYGKSPSEYRAQR